MSDTDLKATPDADPANDFQARRIINRALNWALQEQASLKKQGIIDPVLDDYIENREMQLERINNRLKTSDNASMTL